MLGDLERHRKAVGARLRDLRKARGWNQEDAAHALGVAVKTWSNWERGRTDPYDSNWKKLGEVFDVDPAEVRGTPPGPLGLSGGCGDEDQLDRIEAMLTELLEAVDANHALLLSVAAWQAEQRNRPEDPPADQRRAG